MLYVILAEMREAKRRQPSRCSAEIVFVTAAIVTPTARSSAGRSDAFLDRGDAFANQAVELE